MGRSKKRHPAIGNKVHVSRYFADPEEVWAVLEVFNEGTSQETYQIKSEKTGETRDIYSVHTYRTLKMRMEQTRQRANDKRTMAENIGRKERR